MFAVAALMPLHVPQWPAALAQILSHGHKQFNLPDAAVLTENATQATNGTWIESFALFLFPHYCHQAWNAKIADASTTGYANADNGFCPWPDVMACSAK